MLLALVIWSLTTHPFRDGARFLLVIETPPTCGRSARFSNMLHYKFLAWLGPSPVWPWVAAVYLLRKLVIVFSLFTINRCAKLSPCHTRIFSSCSPLTHSVPHCTVHFIPPCGFYSRQFQPEGHLCAPSSSSTRLLAYLFLQSGTSISPTRKRSFSVFA